MPDPNTSANSSRLNGQGFSVQIFDPNHKRRRFAQRNVGGANWTEQRYGGFSDFTLDTNADFSELTNIKSGDIVEFSLSGTLVFRGEISSRLHSLADPDKLALSGYGHGLQVGRYIAQQRYARPQGGADAALLMRDIARDWVQKFEPNLVVTAQNLGINVETVDAYQRKIKDVFGDLVQNSGNLGCWGVDVVVDPGDANFGLNRLYIRPVSSKADYVISLPGKNVSAAETGEDTADVVNQITLVGGTPRFPNLQYNSSFERPVFSGAGLGNILRDPGFEGQDNWNLYSGTSYKSSGHLEGNAYEGNWFVECDHQGEGFSQQNNNAGIIAGNTYVFSAFCRLEAGGDTWKGRVTLHWLDGSGNTVGQSLMDETVIAPTSEVWYNYAQTAVAPAGATGYWIECKATQGGGNGLLFDLVQLYDTSQLEQDGWMLPAFGSAHLNAVNWAYPDAYHGGYSVYVNIHASDSDGQDAHLEPKGAAAFEVLARQGLTFSAFVKSPPGVTSNGKMLLEVHKQRSDGSTSGVDKHVIPAGSGWPTWTQISTNSVMDTDTVKCECYITFRGDTQILIDALMVRDTSVGLAYIADGPYQNFFRAADVFLGDPLHAAQQQSEITYGVRPDLVTQDSIITDADALSYAKAYFTTNAIPPLTPTVTLIDDFRLFRTGQAVLFLGALGSSFSPNGLLLNIARIKYTWSGDHLETALELFREKPDLASRILQLIQDAALIQGSPAGGGANGGGGGGGGTITPGAAYRTTLAASSTDPTLHDDFVGAPHASAATQMGWANTSAEVALARNSLVHNTAYSTLSAHLAAMEQAIGNGTGSGSTTVYAATAPYFRMQCEFNVLSRVPVASDFAGLPQSTYFANGPDGSLRYESPGLTLNAYWTMQLQNTTSSAVVVNWFVPAVDNYAAAAWQGAQIFTSNGNQNPVSGNFTIPANSTGLLELFFANTTSGSAYNPNNQSEFWWFMDALAHPGIVFLDSATGVAPGQIIIGDATTTTTGLVEVHANAASGHPIVYLTSEVDANITAEASARTTADTTLQSNITAEANARASADALALQKSANFSDVASVSSARTNLGLGSAATQNSSAFDPAGAASTVQAASLQKSANLSDLANTSTARTNLGLGTAATQASTAFDASGAAAAVQASSLQKNANLSDLSSAPTARTNLGLGTASTYNVPVSGNATASQVVLGNDTRLYVPGMTTPPSGNAGGDLAGTYPNPVLAGIITAGSGGDSTHAPAITYDAKGRITALVSTAIAFPVTAVAGRTGAVTLAYADIGGLGTAATLNAPPSGNASASQVVLGNDTRLALASAGTLVTLAAKSVSVPSAGRNYLVTADFSSTGVFSDTCFEAILTSANPAWLISPNLNPRKVGAASWILYVQTGSYVPSSASLQVTLFGRGWTGSSTSSVSATWTGPTLVA